MPIFKKYFSEETFKDRIQNERENATDVLIPLFHTNELWRKNLFSIYREIPVNRLLIGDGGCSDDSLSIIREFPRVVIFDHRAFTSLGYSIRKLIDAVQTEWFIYLHSDVYLPEGWFQKMSEHQKEYDWFECQQRLTILTEWTPDYYSGKNLDRPHSGSQMGRKAAFNKVLPLIEDDYLYRNEDLILARLLEKAGFRYGCVDEVFHYHQVMEKTTSKNRRIRSISLNLELSREEEIRSWMMEIKAIIKYLEPTPFLVSEVRNGALQLLRLEAIVWAEFKDWVARTNPRWLGHLSKRLPLKERFRSFLNASYHLIFG